MEAEARSERGTTGGERARGKRLGWHM
jgi:hypothetical protein